MIIQLTSIWQSRRHGIECFHGHTHYGIRPRSRSSRTKRSTWLFCRSTSSTSRRFYDSTRLGWFPIDLWSTCGHFDHNFLLVYISCVHKNTVGGEIWCSFLSTHAFLLGNGQTCNTRCSILSRFSHFHVSHIPPLQHGAAFSCPAISCLAFPASPVKLIPFCRKMNICLK